jgi:eukaryotic-like serine/threonine-protein kinase
MNEGPEAGMSLAAGQRVGPYEVLAVLGAGGMGEVWRARDTRLSRGVAIKVLLAGAASDAERLRRFEREARAASALNHPNIVTLYEVGREGDLSYIVMELVEGQTLREALADGSLPVKKLLSVSSQVADGLARAHDAGIVHRDLKPENVMLTRDGLVKILDFGLAKLSQPEVDSAGTLAPTITRGTEPGIVMGTVGYMSPEQASGGAVDARSDQFSLGAVLYEMATGRRPFEGKTRPETLAAIIREDPPPVATLNPKVPPPFVWIVERCLAKEPEGRYASTRDLARDLAGVRDRISEPSVSGATPAAAAAARKPRRILAVAALVAVAAAALVAGRWLWKTSPVTPSYRRLTFRNGYLFKARFAQDGQTVVYSAAWARDPIQLFTTQPGSVESRELGTPGAALLSISKSGEMLVLRGETLARVSLAGGAEREILEGVVDADWAPNGTDIAVIRRPVSGTAPGAVTGARVEFPVGKVLFEATHPLRSIRVSRRGDSVAFVESPFRGDLRGFLSLVDRNGKSRRLTQEFSAMADVAWSPRGEEVWFSAAGTGEGLALRAVTLSGRQRVIARVPGSQELLDVAADGRVLLSHWHVRGILKALVPGATVERELSWLDGSIPTDLSDDGKTLLFVERGEGAGSITYSVWKRSTDGSPAVRLGDGRASGLSPDGAWALAVRLNPQPAQLLLIPTGAGETKVLTHDSINHRIAAWFRDGRRILFVGDEPGHEPRLYVQDIEGGAPRAISAEASKGTQWLTWRPISPDGKLAVFFNGQFLLYPVDGGPPRPIPGLLPGEIPIGWDTSGAALYVRDRQTPIRIHRLDVTTGRREFWKEVPSPAANVQFVMTPDGKFYAYGYSEDSSDLYVVEGLK